MVAVEPQENDRRKRVSVVSLAPQHSRVETAKCLYGPSPGRRPDVSHELLLAATHRKKMPTDLDKTQNDKEVQDADLRR